MAAADTEQKKSDEPSYDLSQLEAMEGTAEPVADEPAPEPKKDSPNAAETDPLEDTVKIEEPKSRGKH